MKRRTPNKPSLDNSNPTPNKIRKQDTPGSWKISIIPSKYVKKNNQVQIKGNKFKSSVKNQNITPKKQINGKQTTLKGKTKRKEDEEDDIKSLSNTAEIESDNSLEEINDSSDEADSDAVVEIDEADSGSELEINDATSDEEVENVENDANSDEEVESGEEIQVDEYEEADTNDEAQVDVKSSSSSEESDNSLEEINDSSDESDSDYVYSGRELEVESDEATTDEEVENDANSDEEVQIDEDKKADTVEANRTNTENCITVKGIHQDAEVQELEVEALSKDGKEFNGRKITVGIHGIKKYVATVSGLSPCLDVNYIFQDSIIKSVKIITEKGTHKPNGSAVITFADLKSLQIALSKNGRKFDNHIIKLRPAGEFVQKGTIIEGLSSDSKIQDIFEDCNILFYFHARDQSEKHKLKPITIVYFQDEESVQKALLKNGIKHNDSIMRVYRKDCCIIVRGIKADTDIEKIFTGCDIHSIDLKVKRKTNELAGAAVTFKDFASVKKALSLNMPSGISVHKCYDQFIEVNPKYNDNAPSNSQIEHATKARSINMPPRIRTQKKFKNDNKYSQIRPSLDEKLILLEHFKAKAYDLKMQLRRIK